MDASLTPADLDSIDLHSVDEFVRRGYPWAEWDLLRRHAPIYRYERPGIDPFWSIARHEDIHAISSDAKTFINSGPYIRVTTTSQNKRMWDVKARRDARYGWDPDEPFDMLFMDDPRHSAFRMLIAREFTPARCRDMAARLAAQARRFVADLADALDTGNEIDLVEHFSVKLPLGTICEMMGLPVDDWSSIHRWTDSKFSTDSMVWALPGETREEMRRRLRLEHFAYFDDIIDRCRAHPGDDLASKLVHATIDGKPLTQQQLHGYFSLIFGGGNETSRNAITRGIMALLEFSHQLALLKDDVDGRIEHAVEEILRWASPVVHFARAASRDVELRGQQIRKGDTLVLWYPSANRDEQVFRDPYRFDITRHPNHHLAFGQGAHFCLGASLARHELRAVFTELIRSGVIDRMEVIGEPEWLADIHVGAVTAVAVRARS